MNKTKDLHNYEKINNIHWLMMKYITIRLNYHSDIFCYIINYELAYIRAGNDT